MILCDSIHIFITVIPDLQIGELAVLVFKFVLRVFVNPRSFFTMIRVNFWVQLPKDDHSVKASGYKARIVISPLDAFNLGLMFFKDVLLWAFT